MLLMYIRPWQDVSGRSAPAMAGVSISGEGKDVVVHNAKSMFVATPTKGTLER